MGLTVEQIAFVVHSANAALCTVTHADPPPSWADSAPGWHHAVQRAMESGWTELRPEEPTPEQQVKDALFGAIVRALAGDAVAAHG